METQMITVYKGGQGQCLMYVNSDMDEYDIELMLREYASENGEDYDKDHYSWQYVEDYVPYH